MSGRVVIIGLDGATFDIINPLVGMGKLPAIEFLMSEGISGDLMSTIHPLTPQAWASFATGTNPGRHGIFDFGQRREGSYEIELVTAAHRRTEALWETVSRHGKSVGVINMPLSWPFRRVNGFMVGDMHAPSLEQGTFPEDFWKKVRGVSPEYRLDVMRHWYEGDEPFIADVHDLDAAHCKAALGLWDLYKPDLFAVVLAGVDRTSHAFFGNLDLGADDLGAGHAGAKSIIDCYADADAFIGEMADRLDDDDLLMVVSDHGFGRLERDVTLNRALIDSGFLLFDPVKVRKAAEDFRPVDTGDRDPRHAWHTKLKTGPLEPLPADDESIRRGDVDSRLLGFSTVDWSVTRAYAHGLFGNVSVNLRGREPEGIVWPGRDFHETVDCVRGILESLTDPDDGQAIADRIWTATELYDGRALDRAPDLIVKMRDYSYMTRGACEFLGRELISAPAIPHTGNHRMNGIIICRTAGVAGGTKLDGAGLMDIMPTVLHWLGLPVPALCDGNVLIELAGGGLDDVTYEREQGAEALDAPEPATLDALRGRLAGLGYMV